MAQSSINKLKELNSLSKQLEKAIDVNQKQINECSVEWLQLCSLVKKENEKIVGYDNTEGEAREVVLNQEKVVETSKRDAQDAINSQLINLDFELNVQGLDSVEEFDSD